MSVRARWTLLSLLTIAVVTGVGYIAIQARRDLRAWDPERARKHGNPIPVRTVKVARSNVEESIGGTAVTIPAETATVRVMQGSVARELKRVGAHLGSVVKQGDTLLEFRPEVFEQVVKQRQAALAAAEESLAATEKLVKDRAASLLDLSTARVKVETAKLDLLMAQEDLQGCVVKSPIDGVVADIQAVAGERIDSTVDITQVHRLDPLLVQMDFPQEKLDALQVGQTAEVVLDSFPSETFTGQIVRISPVADTETRVLPVMLEVKNPENRLKAGLTGFVRMRVNKEGMTVPTAALIKQGGKAMTFTVDNAHAHIREVRPGQLMKDGMIEVKEGLIPGEEVVLFGNFTLRDNDSVDTNWHKWARRESAD